MIIKTIDFLLLLGLTLVYVPGNVLGQKIETCFLDRSVRIGSVEYRFQVYVPRGFNK
jgi:hypothetical protein